MNGGHERVIRAEAEMQRAVSVAGFEVSERRCGACGVAPRVPAEGGE